ncbi:Predicted membrane protein [Microbulbifer donghaiensis]|uniref:Predicted membrane protein n=1 Tax=Microbulbifer donghaiensis TaxID=494016 RepID=A0A1M5DV72_9GAMM|nr:DUF2306 domain-containing protein [Microbulbifer donghaiensis]SHF70897.1 Predicted membrane protein [Microbulbifer donghaiensis]
MNNIVNLMRYTTFVFIAAVSCYFVVRDAVPVLTFTGERYATFELDVIIVFLHVLGGFLALFIGPLQFSSRLRKRYPIWHRSAGKVYVYSIFLAAPISFYLLLDFGGVQFALPTFIFGFLWLLNTLVAFLLAVKKRFLLHFQFMVRSYALTFAFVSVRTVWPLLEFLGIIDSATAEDPGDFLFITREWGMLVITILVPEVWFIWRYQLRSIFVRNKTMQADIKSYA